MSRLNKLFVAISGAVLACMLGACGGVQVPSENGQCHEWREWVAPTQNADGSWNEGYCRDR